MNLASPVNLKVAAEKEKVADAIAAKYDSFIMGTKEIPGFGALAVKRVFARQKYRKEAGKADVDGDSTDDDAVRIEKAPAGGSDLNCDPRYVLFLPTEEEMLGNVTGA